VRERVREKKMPIRNLRAIGFFLFVVLVGGLTFFRPEVSFYIPVMGLFLLFSLGLMLYQGEMKEKKE
jgi:hypothetical protein